MLISIPWNVLFDYNTCPISTGKEQSNFLCHTSGGFCLLACWPFQQNVGRRPPTAANHECVIDEQVINLPSPQSNQPSFHVRPHCHHPARIKEQEVGIIVALSIIKFCITASNASDQILPPTRADFINSPCCLTSLYLLHVMLVIPVIYCPHCKSAREGRKKLNKGQVEKVSFLAYHPVRQFVAQ